MLKKITVPIVAFDEERDEIVGEPEHIKVWAWVVGNFAIHHYLWGYELPGSVWSRLGQWTITHIPTGCRMNKGPLDRDEAKERLQWALNFKWRGRPILDEMPTCELLQVVPLVYRDMEKDGDRWARKYRPFIEQAHGCIEVTA